MIPKSSQWKFSNFVSAHFCRFSWFSLWSATANSRGNERLSATKMWNAFTNANGSTNLVHPLIVCVKFHTVDSQQVPSWMISVQSWTLTTSRKYLENVTISPRLRFRFGWVSWTCATIQIITQATHRRHSVLNSGFQFWLDFILLYKYELWPYHKQAAPTVLSVLQFMQSISIFNVRVVDL